MWRLPHIVFFFFFNDTATTEIYTLSLHDALPISRAGLLTCCNVLLIPELQASLSSWAVSVPCPKEEGEDRKSTRLNSSHANISYAVFCLKKKKKKTTYTSLLTTIHCTNRTVQ